MNDLMYIIQRVSYYLQNPEQLLPTASDARQAAEIEKMRHAVEDIAEAKRTILPENRGLATEIICLEFARQMMKEQQGGARQ